MKRPLSNSDSLMPTCPSGEKGMYGRGFQSIMDGLDDDDCGGGDDELCGEQAMGTCGGEKKRRLSVEQVRALEKNFEVENKLEPERKVRLAQELGLQPRQVAVWFQNRRARWKTKQLERDYGALKASYDALRVDYDSLHQDKESLLAEIKELKTKLAEEESPTSFSSVKKEPVAFEAENKGATAAASPEEPPALVYKDGSSVDSDSSAVLNEGTVLNDENSPRCAAGGGMSSSNTAAATGFGSCNSLPQEGASQVMMYSDPKSIRDGGGCFYQQPMLKMEEHEFLDDEEPCSSFFSEEQAPTLSWYYSDHWN